MKKRILLQNGLFKNKKGFTLIELLVVIAIIALLVSILLPSLTKAKDLARDVVCSTQLKSIGMGFEYYVNEYDDTYPFWDIARPQYYGNLNTLWTNAVALMIVDGVESPEDADAKMLASRLSSKTHILPLVYCPNDPKQSADPWVRSSYCWSAGSWPMPFNPRPVGYDFWAHSYSYRAGNGEYQYRTRDDIQHPSQTLILNEFYGGYGYPATGPGVYHLGKTKRLMADYSIGTYVDLND